MQLRIGHVQYEVLEKRALRVRGRELFARGSVSMRCPVQTVRVTQSLTILKVEEDARSALPAPCPIDPEGDVDPYSSAVHMCYVVIEPDIVKLNFNRGLFAGAN
jgi:hypothetical protein